MNLTGKFLPFPFEQLQIPPENVIWNDARLMVGIDDARGLEEEVIVNWSGQKKTFEAGVPDNKVISDGLSLPIALTQDSNTFSINIKLKGSGYLYFTPVGKTTEVKLASTWKSPAFDGQYLPVQTPDISDSGFNAYWKVLQVSRSYPQFWKEGSTYEIERSSFGVKLIQPADGYAKTRRSVKYAILFIALTFVIFLLYRDTATQADPSPSIPTGRFCLVHILCLAAFYIRVCRFQYSVFGCSAGHCRTDRLICLEYLQAVQNSFGLHHSTRWTIYLYLCTDTITGLCFTFSEASACSLYWLSSCSSQEELTGTVSTKMIRLNK